MPLNLDRESQEYSLEVKSSVTIELVAAIHYLSDRSHHSFSEKLANSMQGRLTPNSVKMLKILSCMRLQGLELFEFIVKERAFDDVEYLRNRISKHEDVDFIYNLLGEVLSHDTIRLAMRNRQELHKLLSEKPELMKDNIKGFEYLFFNTKSFRADIVNLLKEMNNSLLHNKLDSLKEDYSRVIKKTEEIIGDRNPIDVAQEIMDRQFKRFFDFKYYYFIPSYFISPHKLRVFCEESQMVVFALGQENTAANEMGDKAAALYKVMSDRTRMEILKAIIAGPTYGKQMAENLNLTTATISHHVEVLKSINFIAEKRKKNIKYFEANEEVIIRVFEEGLDYLFSK
jgi:DNA-binding transcriptional ArsR family regulator